MSNDVRQVLKMANRLTALSDRMESKPIDEHGLALSGVVRDCAYTMRNRATDEMGRLKRIGKWESE